MIYLYIYMAPTKVDPAMIGWDDTHFCPPGPGVYYLRIGPIYMNDHSQSIF